MQPWSIDWGAPWFQPLREPGERVAARVAQGSSVAQALGAEPDPPVRFVAQSALPDGEPYERFIFEQRACPTRDNLHDFFNGLCWLRMPKTKRRLNELQAAQIAANGIGGRRGPVRDAGTLFDENGALLQAPAPIWDSLLARDWRALFIELRPLWSRARVMVFGHALLEQLARPRKNLTAHVWAEPCPLATPEEADAWLSRRCTAQRLAAKPFTPLPVLGIPNWWPENQNFSWYDDSTVFRPGRR
ncbi:DUF3025 domain-containing protein [Ramlibacter sp.]|uniref:DUF3025 domain-containing protein n=1 Tax=Ramlibacter sp. TaxID=1917967 RepID=UPI002D70EBB6|nr:DUF3025 domain-containing protein [Ramlibacter sp.]HYD74963.1 DUF3025 domain-containing protein [Ramlibacter sp.]